MAAKKDIWFHVKDMPGAHTILVTEGKSVDAEALKTAAQIAAYHSRAKYSSNVPVSYTFVKNIKKPPGAKPGMVICKDYKTVYVTPDKNFIESLGR